MQVFGKLPVHQAGRRSVILLMRAGMNDFEQTAGAAFGQRRLRDEFRRQIKIKSASVYIAIDQDVSTLPFSDRRLARRLDADERKEFPARRGIVAESAEHTTGNHLGSRFMHPSRTHTLMRGSENDSDSLRLQHSV